MQTTTRIQPYVSILIASYNNKLYLEESIESAINQTLKNIEIIIVDDCSTDDSVQLIKKFQEKDTRITLLTHSENKGCLQARLSGIREARGEYIQILDGDDWLELNTCEELYSIAKETSADVCHTFFLFEIKGTKEISKPPFCKEYLLNKKEYCSALFAYSYTEREDTIAHGITTSFCKTSIWKEVAKEFPTIENITYTEDLLLTFARAPHVQKALYIPKRYYHYRIDTGITTVKITKEYITKVLTDIYYVSKHITHILKKYALYNEKWVNKRLGYEYKGGYSLFTSISTEDQVHIIRNLPLNASQFWLNCFENIKKDIPEFLGFPTYGITASCKMILNGFTSLIFSILRKIYRIFS